MAGETSDGPQTTAERVREFVTKDMGTVLAVFEQRVAAEETMKDRLTSILGNADLARMVYEYVVLGHLSHHGSLREKLGATNNA